MLAISISNAVNGRTASATTLHTAGMSIIGTSPKKFVVRCICSGFTQVTLADVSWRRWMIDLRSRISGQTSTAMKVRMDCMG